MISSLNFRPEFVMLAKFEMKGYRMLKSPNIARGLEKSKSNTLFSSLKVRDVLMVVICKYPKETLSALIYFSSKTTPFDASIMGQSSLLNMANDLLYSSGFVIRSSSCYTLNMARVSMTNLRLSLTMLLST